MMRELTQDEIDTLKSVEADMLYDNDGNMHSWEEVEKKIFSHHEKWFGGWSSLGWPKDEDSHILNCEDKKGTFPCKMFYHYVHEDDSLWEVSLDDTLNHRHQYPVGRPNERPHISRQWLTRKPITSSWRERIDKYEAEYYKTKS